MLKEALVIGASAAAGTYITNKWGQPIAAQAAKFNVPPTIAHMLIVGSFTAASYFIVKAVL